MPQRSGRIAMLLMSMMEDDPGPLSAEVIEDLPRTSRTRWRRLIMDSNDQERERGTDVS